MDTIIGVAWRAGQGRLRPDRIPRIAELERRFVSARSANAHQDDEIVQSLFLGAELTANIAIWKQAIR